MSKQDIIRAWKDEEYRNSLSAAESAQLPENPAGAVELPDEKMKEAAGGTTPSSYGCAIGGVALSVAVCSPNGTACGTCGFGSRTGDCC